MLQVGVEQRDVMRAIEVRSLDADILSDVHPKYVSKNVNGA